MRSACLVLALALSACGKEPSLPPAAAPRASTPPPATPPPKDHCRVCSTPTEGGACPQCKALALTVSRDPMPGIGNYPPPPAGFATVPTAVAEFQDKTGARLSLAAAEQLETLATLSRRFRLIDQAKLKAILKEQGVEGSSNPSELARAGKARGVDYLFLGVVTTFRLALQRPSPAGGTGDKAPLRVDTSSMAITADIGVIVSLVDTATGEIVSKQSGEVTKEMKAAAWGIRVIGIGGDAKNNVRVDSDSQARLIRYALDQALRRMLPDIDDKLGRPQASLCSKCRSELPIGAKSCAKCGTPIPEKCGCGAEVEAGATFCGKCGKKRG